MQRRLLRTAIPAGCLAVAGLSLLIPSAPTTDSWGWILWGREVLHLDLVTTVNGSPSWKPLPVLVTTPLAVAGAAAPALWLIVARAAGLAALFAGYRLGARLAGRWAGLLTLTGVVLSTHWLRAMAHGYTEPLAIGLLFAAVLAHLSGRPRWAIASGALIALTRPEAWCLVLLYGVSQWWRGKVHWSFVAAVTAGVPALWLLPDWVGSGDPLHADKVARSVSPGGPGALLQALTEAATIVPVPLAAAAVAAALVALRRRDASVVQLAAGVLVWTALLAILMLAGYPASARFFVLPAALVCVLGAVGVVRLAEQVRGSGVRLAAAGLLAALALPFTFARVGAIEDEAHATVTRAEIESSLRTVVHEAGPELRRCGGPTLPRGLAWTRGAVAWDLGLPLGRVRAMATSVPDFVDRLSAPSDEPLPRLVRGRPVTVRPTRHAYVLLAPFGSAHVRMAGHLRSGLTTVAAAGIWRAVARDPGGCTSQDRRVVAARRAARA